MTATLAAGWRGERHRTGSAPAAQQAAASYEPSPDRYGVGGSQRLGARLLSADAVDIDGLRRRSPYGIRSVMSWLARLGSMLLIAWLTLAVHELGHAIVYWLTGYPAWISFQRVHSGAEPSLTVEAVSLAVGPLVTLVIAVVASRTARARGGWVTPTVAFANASLRIFPAAVAVILGVKRAPNGFSDEGNVALILGTSPLLLGGPPRVRAGHSVWACGRVRSVGRAACSGSRSSARSDRRQRGLRMRYGITIEANPCLPS